MSRKPCSSKSDASHSADSTSASGVALPYFCSSRLSSEPALTPMRIGVPASVGGPRDLLDLVVELLDVARVDPHRRAARVDRGEHVLRLEVDVGDHRDLRLPRDRRPARPRRPASDRPPARSGSRTRSARRSAAASRRCRRYASSSSTAPTPVRLRRRPPDPTWICRLTRRSASLVGTAGIPSEIAVICCATPRCGSKVPGSAGSGLRDYGTIDPAEHIPPASPPRSGTGCHGARVRTPVRPPPNAAIQASLTGFTTSATSTSSVKQMKIPATT